MEQICQRTTKNGLRCKHKARVKADARHTPSPISEDVYYCMPCAVLMFKSSIVICEGVTVTVGRITYQIEIVCPEEMYDAKELRL